MIILNYKLKDDGLRILFEMLDYGEFKIKIKEKAEKATAESPYTPFR